MKKVLATDLDGTLFYPKQIKRCIPKKNTKFLQDWIDEGNKLVLVTSRSHQFVEKLKKEIKRPVDFIACNASQIVVDDNLVRDKYINPKELDAVIKYLDEKVQPIAYLMTTKDYPLIIKNNKNLRGLIYFIYRIWYFFQFKYREDFTLSNEVFDEEIKKGLVYKVMVFYGFGKKKKILSKEINKFLRENYPDIESSWTSIVNELTPVDCNKGAGLEDYAEHLGFKPNDIYVVGDSGNDITMFNKFYENSYCMAHGYPGVKKYAKHTISRVFKLRKQLLKGAKKDESK